MLKDFCLYQAELEDEIPKVYWLHIIESQTLDLTALQLKENLPVLEVDAVESGKFYINLHIVTGRKPSNLRTGDLLSDGTRQATKGSKHNAEEATMGELRTNKWIRYLQ
jgi:hypothetical protein